MVHFNSNQHSRPHLPRRAAECIDQCSDVDHQHDFSFADFGRAGDAGDRFQPLADRLDYHLLLPHEGVDEDAGYFFAGARHDDEPLRVGAFVTAAVEPEGVREA